MQTEPLLFDKYFVTDVWLNYSTDGILQRKWKKLLLTLTSHVSEYGMTTELICWATWLHAHISTASAFLLSMPSFLQKSGRSMKSN